jgi:hypothetical protein
MTISSSVRLDASTSTPPVFSPAAIELPAAHDKRQTNPFRSVLREKVSIKRQRFAKAGSGHDTRVVRWKAKTVVVSRTVWREVEVVRGGAQRLVATTGHRR